MRKRKIQILLIVIAAFLLCACEYNKNTPLYMLYEDSSVDLSTDVPKEEFTPRYINAMYYMLEPDFDEEKSCFGENSGYISLDDNSFKVIREAINNLIATYYNINHPYNDFSDDIKDSVTPDLYQVLKHDSYLQNRLDAFKEYRANTIIESISFLPYHLVKEFTTDNNKIYRVWVSVNEKTDAVDKKFYDNTHYVKGYLSLELYVYFIQTSENSYKICAWDEINKNPDLEVIYTRNGIEENSDPFARQLGDKITPAKLVKALSYMDEMELASIEKRKLIETIKNAIYPLTNVDYKNISIDTMRDSYEYIDENLQNFLNDAIFSDYIDSIKNDQASISIEFLDDDPQLFIYCDSEKEYIVLNLACKIQCTTSNNIDVDRFQFVNGEQEEVLSCVVRPLEEGDYEIHDFLFANSSFQK